MSAVSFSNSGTASIVRVGVLFATMVLLVFSSLFVRTAAAQAQPKPRWINAQPVVSDDGHAVLRWTVDGNGRVPLFRLTEDHAGARRLGFTDVAEARLYRVRPGTYTFRVQACTRDASGYPDCGKPSKPLKLIISDAIEAGLSTPRPMHSQSLRVSTAAEGPGLLTPGLWSNPDRSGHGWSFYWTSRLSLPESHELHGPGYDLVGFWYTYEAKARYLDGPGDCGEGGGGSECYWVYDDYRPVVARLNLARTSAGTYSGSARITRAGGEFDSGNVTVTFDSAGTTAQVDWAMDFGRQHLEGEDTIRLLAGTDGSGDDLASHFAGLWSALSSDTALVAADVGSISEAVEVVFFDAAGDPGWMQASYYGDPDPARTSLCFYYPYQGYAPNESGRIFFHESGCDADRTASLSNRNGYREFSGTEAAKLWLDYILPDGHRVRYGSASFPFLLRKRASFHRIWFRGSDRCQISDAVAECEVPLTWFTDGHYPEAAVHVRNLENQQSNLVNGSAFPAVEDFSAVLTQAGTYRFELRMKGTSQSTLLAQTGPFTVEQAGPTLVSPTDLVVEWLDFSARRYQLSWQHSQSAQVDHYELTEVDPAGASTTYSVSPGSNRSRQFSKSSGPFGTHVYRVAACKADGVCSAPAPGLEWTVPPIEEDPEDIQFPWSENAYGTLGENQSWDYALGYHFVPAVDGAIVRLGGYFSGVRLVRLYERSSGRRLASVWIGSDNRWNHVAIEPVPVRAGVEYTVAAYLQGSGASYRYGVSLPQTFGDITILGGTSANTSSNWDAIPTNSISWIIYGQADIGFRPSSGTPPQPPVIDPIDDQSHEEGDSVSLSVSAFDADGSIVSYSAGGNLPANLVIGSSGIISGTLAPGSADASPYRVTVTVTDDDGLTAQTAFNWTVQSVSSPNTPPVITQPEDQEHVAGTAVATFSIAVADADGDPVTCSFSGLPAGISEPEECTLAGELTAPAGNYTVGVVANDGQEDSEPAHFMWTVTAPGSDANPEVPPAPAAMPSMTPSAASSRVGSTAGAFAVDETGNAQYRIPILAAPGSGGFAPDLAFVYSSSHGNGPLGMGWTLSGTSMITRCPATIAVDGPEATRGVTLTGADRFCLDGERLVVVSGAYGENGAEYRTEVDGIARIVSMGDVGGGPAYFTVWRKNGTREDFGRTSDSFIEARRPGDGGTALLWARNRMTDTSGNYIDYHYDELGGASTSPVEFTLDKVTYTGNERANTAAYAEIEFHYGAGRPDATTAYLAGSSQSQTRLITRVDSRARVNANRSLESLRSYLLNYADDGQGRRVLTSLTECRDSGASRCFPPTRFDWKPSRHAINGSGVSVGGLFDSKHVATAVADVSGDGRPDLLLTRRQGKGFVLEVAPALPSGGFGARGQGYPIPSDGTDHAPVRVHAIDLNADGFQDLVYPTANGWRARLSDETRLSEEISVGGGCCNLSNPPLVRVMDFDGDGLSDLLTQRADGSGENELVWLRNRYSPAVPGSVEFDAPVPLAVAVDTSLFPAQSSGGWQRDDALTRLQNTNASGAALARPFDYDGDGRVDLLVRLSRRYIGCGNSCSAAVDTPAGSTTVLTRFAIEQPENGDVKSIQSTSEAWASFYLVLLADGQNGFVQAGVVGTGTDCTVADACEPFSDLPAVRRAMPADINADGLADFAFLDAFYDWRYRLNSGAGFLPQSVPLVEFSDFAQSSRAGFVDMTGDGFPELIYPSSLSSSGATWQQHDNQFGHAFASARNTGIRFGNAEEFDQSLLADFDGDGMLDNLFIDLDSRGRVRSTTTRFYAGVNSADGSSSLAVNRLSRITDGFGAETILDYRPLTDAQVYTRLRNAASMDWGGFAAYDFIAPLYVVSEVAVSAPQAANANATRISRYHYVGARLQTSGRGFLGFAEVIAWDPLLKIRSHTRYRQDFPFVGMVGSETRYLSGDSERFDPINDPWSRAPIVWGAVTSDSGVPAGTSGVLVSHAVNEWASRSEGSAAPARFIYPARRLERFYTLAGDFSHKILSTTTVANPYGNPDSTVVQTWEQDAGMPVSTLTTRRTWFNDRDNWRIGRVLAESVVHQRPVASSTTRNVTYTYSTATAQLTGETLEPGNAALEVNTDYVLDSFGNRIVTTVTGAGMASRTRRDTYDSLGRFVNQTFNSYGQSTLVVLRRDVFGNIMQSRNIDGVLSVSAADDLGRPFVTWNQTGAWSKTRMSFGSGVHCPQSNTAWHTIETAGGSGARYTCFDRTGQIIRQANPGFDGTMVRVDTEFDQAGRKVRESVPYFAGATPYWTETTYDAAGRVRAVQAADGNDLIMDFDAAATFCGVPGGPRQVLSRNGLGQRRLEISNALGEVVSVVDADCGRIDYHFDAVGNLVRLVGADGVQVSMSYDLAGHRTMLSDPDKGISHYAYNALGEVTRQLDAKSQAIDLEHDLMGRVTRRYERTGVSSLEDESYQTVTTEQTEWINDSTSGVKGKGQLRSRKLRNGTAGEWVHAQEFAYDELGRMNANTSSQGALALTERTTFDQYGRVFQQFDASGDSRGIRYHYNAYGYLEKRQEAREGVAGAAYQWVRGQDARGNATQVILGDGLEAYAEYDTASGRLVALDAYGSDGVEIQRLSYEFDSLGNLLGRHDTSGSRDLQETFRYDLMNRLKSVMLSSEGAEAVETLRLEYDASGNIVHKSDVGEYLYGANGAGPHAVTRAGGTAYTYDANGNQTGSTDGRLIDYTVSDRAEWIRDGSQETRFVYGTGQKRIRREDQNNVDGATTRWYFGSVERISEPGAQPYFKRHIDGVALVDYYPATGASHVWYLLRDHLGSIHTVVDESERAGGSFSMYFSAFGERRNPDGRTRPSVSTLQTLNRFSTRGFTGHEHADGMGIVHMNGRIYDPKLGRFLQADPLVQAPRNSQSLNRYTYVFNNPLSYTDPTGNFGLKRFFKRWGRVIAAVGLSIMLPGSGGWLAAMGITNSFAQAVLTGFITGAIGSGSMKGAVVGAFVGAALFGLNRVFTQYGGTGALDSSQVIPSEDSLKHLYGPGGPGEGFYRVSVDPATGKFVDISPMSMADFRDGDVLFSNGMLNTLQDGIGNATSHLHQIKLLESQYILNFNRSVSFMGDLREAALDVIGAHTGIAHSDLAKSLAQSLHVASENGVTGLTLVGHSQGGAITASALRLAKATGLNLSSVSRVALHGAPINAAFARRFLGSEGRFQVTSRAQFGDAVHVFGGLNIANPLQIPAALLRAPHMFGGDPIWSPHTVPCGGGRAGLCAP
ncbi:putative Ig domain-containing protein [Elongatibacter sediminis]|uniref:Ig domain-containing protein n=1 Tax=Elongatibacter sediminis TaxID=3119006 RepID=A0AAW9RGL7_9GAMM